MRQLSLLATGCWAAWYHRCCAAWRRTDPDRASALCGATLRRLGPLLPAHRIGRANLRAAYPDKDADWIEAVLRGAWENLGRVAGEFVHLGRLWDYDPDQPNRGRIVTDDEPLFQDLLNDGKPALCFTAHLGNWELPAVMAAAHGMASAVVYRMPNNRAVAAEIARIREPLMGRLIRTRSQARAGNGGGAATRRPFGDAGRSALLARGRRRRSSAGAARPTPALPVSPGSSIARWSACA